MPSARFAYVNGRFLRHAEACVHIEDRGLQFADAVYEVCGVMAGRIMDEEEHLDRLERSLRELRHRHAGAPRRAEAGHARTGAQEPHPRTGSSICRSRAARSAAIIRPRPIRRARR